MDEGIDAKNKENHWKRERKEKGTEEEVKNVYSLIS
jgi:hypothetical protein